MSDCNILWRNVLLRFTSVICISLLYLPNVLFLSPFRRQKLLSCGPRILTFFLYLSDVEEGGETVFTNLKLKVKPKRGRALLWPSVQDGNPEEQDPRTNHAAAAVIKGKTYAANAWIHLYDFTKSNLWGCTGAFDYI